MQLRAFVFLLAAFFWVGAASAQVIPDGDQPPGLPEVEADQPEVLTIQQLRVEGVEDDNTQDYVLRTSGLSEGQQVTVPTGDALAEAIRSIYGTGLFSDVKILREETTDEGAHLVIRVQPEPRLNEYQFAGVTNRQRRDLREEVPLLAGRPVRPADIGRAERVIREYFSEQGYHQTEVATRRRDAGDNRVNLEFVVDVGQRAVVQNISFHGNEIFSDRRLRGQMDDTRERRWWRFWSTETLDRSAFEEDLQRVVDYYNANGYYDARIVDDSIRIESEGIYVDVTVHEGPQYFVRNVEWEGNTVFPDAVLTETLGLREGDVFNTEQFQENLYGSQRGTDLSSMYRNRGYMLFQVEPTIRVTEGDSIDLTLDLHEGEVFEFGDINITGNMKTKDHVIRRELYTVPGNTFTQESIQESIRRLMQLNYFSQESLAQGPSWDIDEEGNTVDLTYDVEEVGSDQLELSGTWGRLGLVLQLQFSFNNFSIQNLFNTEAYRPLPTGDGQRLSLGIQTNGRYYQSYSLSFTEPWFRGRPTPIGGSVSYSRFSSLPGGMYSPYGFGGVPAQQDEDGLFEQFNSRLFYQQRLRWPDDNFNTSTAVGYRYYNNRGGEEGLVPTLPTGARHQLVLEQGLSRNSLNNPMFPSRGSRAELSVEVAPPLGDFVQYHKWRFNTSWNAPLSDDFSINVSGNYGYIGTLTGDPVEFQRFIVGGSPFDYARVSYGDDPVFLRGYPAQAIGPRETRQRQDGSLQTSNVGGRIMNKYTAELRWMAIQTQQLRAAPYLFFDAANTWRDFESYNPAQLYRSAGVGARLFLPIVGMVEISYGYNFDLYPDPRSPGLMAPRGWTFQFSLGQGEGQ